MIIVIDLVRTIAENNNHPSNTISVRLCLRLFSLSVYSQRELAATTKTGKRKRSRRRKKKRKRKKAIDWDRSMSFASKEDRLQSTFTSLLLVSSSGSEKAAHRVQKSNELSSDKPYSGDAWRKRDKGERKVTGIISISRSSLVKLIWMNRIIRETDGVADIHQVKTVQWFTVLKIYRPFRADKQLLDVSLMR